MLALLLALSAPVPPYRAPVIAPPLGHRVMMWNHSPWLAYLDKDGTYSCSQLREDGPTPPAYGTWELKGDTLTLRENGGYVEVLRCVRGKWMYTRSGWGDAGMEEIKP